ncbi:MAG: dihydrolipoyl dehydrogenase [Bacteroidales bacterium]|jgi:dihydrolipoamide dehydrogenase|nr:dihydrolipoyl dehydrogenase [Bacteroidales bacterium]
MNYDVIIIGSGPGGYVSAIRASQLKLKVAVVEKENLGGICLNWGCIPTKSLLKSAQIFEYAKHAADYGISIQDGVKPDFNAIMKRSRDVAGNMSKGIQFLFKKNKVELILGFGKLAGKNKVEVTCNSGEKTIYTAKHIIIATGARSRELPNLLQNGQNIIGYRQALTLEKQPGSMVVVGSGAIGSEFACFYKSIGTDVTLIEFMPTLIPNEDEEVARQLERSFKKMKMKVYTNSSVYRVDVSDKKCNVFIKTKKGEEVIETDIVLSAVGIAPNTEGIGLEETGVITENNLVKVDECYKTNVEGIYAIGDIIKSPALAHVASAEGIICVEKIAGLNPEPVNYGNIPGCIYTNPEISSVGLTENGAKEAGYDIKVGKFPYSANGKASASGQKDGFVKLIFDAKNDKLLGAHMIGENVTEMISELVIAKKLGITSNELLKIIHPHPTMSEATVEAAAAALGKAIHM